MPPSAVVDVRVLSAERCLSHDEEWHTDAEAALKDNKRARIEGELYQDSLGTLSFNVAGVSLRQNIVDSLEIGQVVHLAADDNNQADPNAVKVCTLDGDQVGFVPREQCTSVRLRCKTTPYCQVIDLISWAGPTGVKVEMLDFFGEFKTRRKLQINNTAIDCKTEGGPMRQAL